MKYVVTLPVHGIKVPEPVAVDKLLALLAPQSGSVVRRPGEDGWFVCLTVDARSSEVAVAKARAHVAVALECASSAETAA